LQELFELIEFGPTVQKQFPLTNGLLTFSRPGFNKSKSQALLFFDHQRGLLASEMVFELYLRDSVFWQSAGRKTVMET
jgi:hypothetical protein